MRFFDVFGEQGHPMRATISQMGPQLLSRLMQLNETQDGVLNIVFRIADERGLLLIDLKDLRSMLDWVSKHAKEYTTKYGNISTTTVGAIQRALLQLESQGADKFFGEPSFDIYDLMQTEGGKGVMNVLAADKLNSTPPSPKWATWNCRNSCSSSTRPTCSSTAPPKPCSTRSNR